MLGKREAEFEKRLLGQQHVLLTAVQHSPLLSRRVLHILLSLNTFSVLDFCFASVGVRLHASGL